MYGRSANCGRARQRQACTEHRPHMGTDLQEVTFPFLNAGTFRDTGNCILWRAMILDSKERIVFRCGKCRQRLFDYMAGDMTVEIEMKCSRCKRVLLLKKYSEALIRRKAVNNEIRI